MEVATGHPPPAPAGGVHGEDPVVLGKVERLREECQDLVDGARGRGSSRIRAAVANGLSGRPVLQVVHPTGVDLGGRCVVAKREDQTQAPFVVAAGGGGQPGPGRLPPVGEGLVDRLLALPRHRRFGAGAGPPLARRHPGLTADPGGWTSHSAGTGSAVSREDSNGARESRYPGGTAVVKSRIGHRHRQARPQPGSGKGRRPRFDPSEVIVGRGRSLISSWPIDLRGVPRPARSRSASRSRYGHRGRSGL